VKKRLENKVAIVTGGGVGIGKAVAVLFAEEGAMVVVGDINKDTGSNTVKEIQTAGGKAIFVGCDTSKFKDVENLVNKTVLTYGKLDIIVNNAGIASMNKCADTSLEEWDRGIAIDLTGVFYGCKFAIPAMLKNGSGSIINVSSLSGLFGDYSMCWYNAAKGGVANLDYARQGIRCNAINPGFTLTEMVREGWENDVKFREGIGRNYPMGRPGTAREVAYCALFLASDESSIVNGVNLLCDGGITAHTGQPDFANMDEYLSRKPVKIPPD
jgi:NAD(P)-dependent dehydrogenase (short-subunit alcohol dehydrogenase family)